MPLCPYQTKMWNTSWVVDLPREHILMRNYQSFSSKYSKTTKPFILWSINSLTIFTISLKLRNRWICIVLLMDLGIKLYLPNVLLTKLWNLTIGTVSTLGFGIEIDNMCCLSVIHLSGIGNVDIILVILGHINNIIFRHKWQYWARYFKPWDKGVGVLLVHKLDIIIQYAGIPFAIFSTLHDMNICRVQRLYI